MRVAIAGLVHGHVGGFLNLLQSHPEVELVGIWDPDGSLRQQFAKRPQLAKVAFYAELGNMLDDAKPDAVASFTSTLDHPAVVEACAPKHIPVMMEKPLAVSVADAKRIERAAAKGKIDVIVNYETTWYASHAAIWKLFKEQKSGGEIRKMVAMDGHEGPKEIHVGPEFLSWLTDPVKNGGGALFDFGCYGANLMTWIMDNARPISVTARTLQIKPSVYPKVDDEADILVEYPKAIGIIQGSWNWPQSRKDFEVYGETAYAIATGGSSLRVRLGKAGEDSRTPPALAEDSRDSVGYLVSVVRGRRHPEGLSSLANNLIVTEILEAARESAKSGKAVRLQ